MATSPSTSSTPSIPFPTYDSIWAREGCKIRFRAVDLPKDQDGEIPWIVAAVDRIIRRPGTSSFLKVRIEEGEGLPKFAMLQLFDRRDANWLRTKLGMKLWSPGLEYDFSRYIAAEYKKEQQDSPPYNGKELLLERRDSVVGSMLEDEKESCDSKEKETSPKALVMLPINLTLNKDKCGSSVLGFEQARDELLKHLNVHDLPTFERDVHPSTYKVEWNDPKEQSHGSFSSASGSPTAVTILSRYADPSAASLASFDCSMEVAQAAAPASQARKVEVPPSLTTSMTSTTSTTTTALPNATATIKRDVHSPFKTSIKRDVHSSFKTFATQQRTNIAAKLKQDKEVKLNGLKKFSANFKLQSADPADLIPIIANSTPSILIRTAWLWSVSTPHWSDNQKEDWLVGKFKLWYSTEVQVYEHLIEQQGHYIPKLLTKVNIPITKQDYPEAFPMYIPPEAQDYLEMKGLLFHYIDGFVLDDVDPYINDSALCRQFCGQALQVTRLIQDHGILNSQAVPANVLVRARLHPSLDDRDPDHPSGPSHIVETFMFDFAHCQIRDTRWSEEDWDREKKQLHACDKMGDSLQKHFGKNVFNYGRLNCGRYGMVIMVDEVAVKPRERPLVYEMRSTVIAD